MSIDKFIKSVVYPNTMCSREQVTELNNLLEKTIINEIKGDIIECGTWRGGLACLMLKSIIDKKLNKKLYIYDTFSGMPQPTNVDVSFDGESAVDQFTKLYKEGNDTVKWCRAGIEVVSKNLEKVTNNFETYSVLVKGKVENTLFLEENLPKQICLMRLDTDWYKSTKIELETVYPRLSVGGIIIVDDYNHWQGQQKAVDEFFNKLPSDTYKKTVGTNKSLIIEKLTKEN